MKFSDCNKYIEDQFICFDSGEPKGQCANCGAKWYDHRLEVLPENERESAREIQARNKEKDGERFC